MLMPVRPCVNVSMLQKKYYKHKHHKLEHYATPKPDCTVFLSPRNYRNKKPNVTNDLHKGDTHAREFCTDIFIMPFILIEKAARNNFIQFILLFLSLLLSKLSSLNVIATFFWNQMYFMILKIFSKLFPMIKTEVQ